MSKTKKKWMRKNESGEDSEIMLKVLENQVTEVRDTMKNNIEKMKEREGKLEDLEARADILSGQTTAEFKRLSVKTNQKIKQKSKRIYYILAGIIIAGVILIALILTLNFTGVFSDS